MWRRHVGGWGVGGTHEDRPGDDTGAGGANVARAAEYSAEAQPTLRMRGPHWPRSRSVCAPSSSISPLRPRIIMRKSSLLSFSMRLTSWAWSVLYFKHCQHARGNAEQG